MRPDGLSAHFQPIVDLARGTVTGYEALARFEGPPRQPPDVWFAAAHREGRGDELEALALQTALEGRGHLPANCFLTVNVGPRAMLSHPVARVFADAGDLRGVVLEVTEQQPVDDYGALLAVIDPLRTAGALLAIDDAGAGFSSLKHVTTLRPDLVKVDRGLVAGIDADETKAAVVETLGIFASRVDAWLLAEGIENSRELERCIALGVPLGQGYGLGRPAAEMADIDPGVAELCRRRTTAGRESDLLRLVEVAPVARAGESDAAIASTLLVHPGSDWVVALDEFGRPAALVSRVRRGPEAIRVPALTVTEGDRPADVARRIATRPPEERYAPVAVCDELGRLIGIVRVERLLLALADLADEVAPGAAVSPRASGTPRRAVEA